MRKLALIFLFLCTLVMTSCIVVDDRPYHRRGSTIIVHDEHPRSRERVIIRGR